MDTLAYWLGLGLIPFIIGGVIMTMISYPRWRQVPIVLVLTLLIVIVAIILGSPVIGAIIGCIGGGLLLRQVFRAHA